MIMCYAFLELINEDRRRDWNEGTESHIFVTVFPELTQIVTQSTYIAADS